MENDQQKERWLSASKLLTTVKLPRESGGVNVSVIELKYSDTHAVPHFWVNYEPTPHRHSFFELHLLTSGLQTYRMDGELFPVESGYLLLIPPNTLHAIPYCTAAISKFSICFSKSSNQAENEWIWSALPKDAPLFLPNAQAFVRLFELMMEIAASGKKGWEAALRQMMSVLIVMLAQESGLPEQTPPVKRHETCSRINFLEQFIHDNLDMAMTVQSLADYMHISTRQLNRDIQRERGMTGKALIETIKVKAAERLLKDGEKPMIDIALSLGFPDESTFSRFFKRNTGLPPGKYRTAHNNDSGG